MNEPKAGDESLCRVCGRLITYTGEWWRHVGANPRHDPKPTRGYYAESEQSETAKSKQGSEWFYQI